MATVTGGVRVTNEFTQTDSTSFPVSIPLSSPLSSASAYTNDTNGANKVNLLYYKALSLTANTPTTLDLTSLTDPFGGAVNFARVRVIEIVNTSTTDGQTITVGNAAANTWTSMISGTGTIPIHPSTTTNANCGRVLFEAPNTTGYSVNSTNKNLKLDPGAVTLTAHVMLVGCSA